MCSTLFQIDTIIQYNYPYFSTESCNNFCCRYFLCGKGLIRKFHKKWLISEFHEKQLIRKFPKFQKGLSYLFKVALVGQEPVLYARSIEENICYGLREDEWDTNSVEEAARMANAHTFITELKEGYKTQTGEKGVQMSG